MTTFNLLMLTIFIISFSIITIKDNYYRKIGKLRLLELDSLYTKSLLTFVISGVYLILLFLHTLILLVF